MAGLQASSHSVRKAPRKADPSTKGKAPVDTIDLTLDSDSDSDIEFLPPKKRSKVPSQHTAQRQRLNTNHRPLVDDPARASKERAEKATKQRRAREFAEELTLARETRRKVVEKQREVDREQEARDGPVATVLGQGATALRGQDTERNVLYGNIKKAFSAAHITVKTVTHFSNRKLEERFDEGRRALIQAGRSTKEVLLFHGTAAANIESILKTGFRVGGVAAHGQTEGIGVYLAEKPTISVGFCAGGTRMFACRVLLGNISRTPIFTAMHTTPLGAGKDPHDSYSGSFGGDDMNFYVVRDPRLILPSFVIELNGPGGQLNGMLDDFEDY